MIRAMWAVLILAASSFSVFAGVDSDALFQQAFQLESKGEYEQALTLYQQVISQYPDDPAAGPDNAGFHVKYAAGLLAMKNGDAAAVKTIAAEIISLNASPQQKSNQLYLAGALLENTGFVQDALSVFQQVISQYPDDLTISGLDEAWFHVKYLTGLLAIRNGDVAAVKAVADDIMSLNASPQQKPNQLYVAGVLLEGAGFWQDALSVYQQISSQYPNDTASGPDNAGFKVKYLAGLLATQNGDIAAVKTTATDIISLNSSLQQKPNQLYLAGTLLENTGFLQEALSVFQQIISQYPDRSMASGLDNTDFHVKYLAGLLATRKGDAAAVKTIAAEIISLDASPQQRPSQLYVAGYLLEGVRLWQDAQSAYQQVITEYPDSPSAQTARVHKDGIELLASIYDNDIAAAISGTAALEVKYAGSRPELTDMLFIIGEAYHLVGTKNNQDEFFRQSASLLEKDIFASGICNNLKASVSYMLGLNYERLGEYARAADAFQNSYLADKNFTYADYCVFAVGHCYVKLSRLDPELQSDVKPIIRSQYQQLISEFPQSGYATYAKEWLENNK